MATDRKLIALLQRRGYSVTPAVREALDAFLATIAPERSAEHVADDDDDEDWDEDPDAPDHDREAAADLAPSRSIACPHCGEHLAIVVDLGGGDQDTIQDCEVCCCPIRVIYSVEDGRLGSFSTGPG
jgi:hypothetical protein